MGSSGAKGPPYFYWYPLAQGGWNFCSRWVNMQNPLDSAGQCLGGQAGTTKPPPPRLGRTKFTGFAIFYASLFRIFFCVDPIFGACMTRWHFRLRFVFIWCLNESITSKADLKFVKFLEVYFLTVFQRILLPFVLDREYGESAKIFFRDAPEGVFSILCIIFLFLHFIF